MIRISNLCKAFGGLQVLQNLFLTIPAGGVTAILGPNAAGKTTMIKAILGLVHPDSGSICIDGLDISGQTAYRQRLGYMPQIARFPENLAVAEILAMIKSLRACSREPDYELLDAFKLREELPKPVRTLSGGTRQKLSATIAFLFRPDILILDEPTAGLDPLASSRLKDKIAREKARGCTIILTSHIMSEVEEMADQLLYLQDGSITYNGELREMILKTGETRLERAIARLMQEES